jgi:O-antigen/teichoic acid export membrane protein
VIGTWLALGLFVGAEPIIEVLAGDGWEPSVGLLRIQSAALIATFVIVSSGYVLLSMRRHRDILLANVAGLLTSLGLTAVLVPAHDATGAAVALLVAEFTLAAASLTAVIRLRPDVGRSLRRAPVLLGAGLVAALPGLLPGVPALVAAVIAMLLYPLLLAALRRFPPEVADALRGTGILGR